MYTLVIAVFGAALVGIPLAVLCIQLYAGLRVLRQRYAPVQNVEKEIAKLKSQWTTLERDHDRAKAAIAQDRAQLEGQLLGVRDEYESVKRQLAAADESIDDVSCGLYKPHFDFAASEDFKEVILDMREEQKRLAREDRAILIAIAWNVGGSAKEGERMTKQYSKLLLRAFNGECDAAVAQVTWNNIVRMEERIKAAREGINKLGATMKISITDEYLNLKLKELRLTYEYETKRYKEQEEQRRIREQMREEERARREYERAKEEAEREEVRYERALEKARKELSEARGQEVQQWTEHVKKLEQQLEEAHRQKEKALSMAQLTKTGYIYVISNIGSFGDDVFKVGMTRRLDPMDRVKELGDASVPFPFDVHAMIYAENAPELEGSLHDALEQHRVNLVNERREFFKVRLDEIERVVAAKGHAIQLTKIAEAREYRESAARRAAKQAVTSERRAGTSE